MTDTHQYGSLREKIAAETKARKARYAEFEALTRKANAAGLAAGESCIPAPMTVFEAEGLSSRPKAGGKSWYEPEGLCGFAWVWFPDGKSSFAKWATKNKVASKAYRGGVEIWVGYFNQSVARKEAYAEAYAKVMNEAGIKCYAGSRLD